MPSFRDIVNSRRVFVLGSAPTASLNELEQDEILICINGSQNIDRSRVPDILIVNGFTVKQVSEINRVTMNLFRGLRAKHLVCVINAFDMPTMRASLRDAGLEWESDEEISKVERARIIERAISRRLTGTSGSRNVASTGMTAALWAKECGAASVRISGITLQGGHSYVSGDTFRGHIEMDRECFAACGLTESSPLKVQRLR